MATNMALKFIQIYLALSIGISLRFRKKNWDLLGDRKELQQKSSYGLLVKSIALVYSR